MGCDSAIETTPPGFPSSLTLQEARLPRKVLRVTPANTATYSRPVKMGSQTGRSATSKLESRLRRTRTAGGPGGCDGNRNRHHVPVHLQQRRLQRPGVCAGFTRAVRVHGHSGAHDRRRDHHHRRLARLRPGHRDEHHTEGWEIQVTLPKALQVGLEPHRQHADRRHHQEDRYRRWAKGRRRSTVPLTDRPPCLQRYYYPHRRYPSPPPEPCRPIQLKVKLVRCTSRHVPRGRHGGVDHRP